MLQLITGCEHHCLPSPSHCCLSPFSLPPSLRVRPTKSSQSGGPACFRPCTQEQHQGPPWEVICNNAGVPLVEANSTYSLEDVMEKGVLARQGFTFNPDAPLPSYVEVRTPSVTAFLGSCHGRRNNEAACYVWVVCPGCVGCSSNKCLAYPSAISLRYTPLLYPSATPLCYTPLLHPSAISLCYIPLLHPSATSLCYTHLLHPSATPICHRTHTKSK
jgi:hypothetical protein